MREHNRIGQLTGGQRALETFVGGELLALPKVRDHSASSRLMCFRGPNMQREIVSSVLEVIQDLERWERYDQRISTEADGDAVVQEGPPAS